MRKAKEKQKPADRVRADINSEAAEALARIHTEQDLVNQRADEHEDQYDEELNNAEADEAVPDSDKEQEDEEVINLASEEEFPNLVSKISGVAFFRPARQPAAKEAPLWPASNNSPH